METTNKTDIDKQNADRYYLEYHFIPMLTQGVQTAELEPEALLQTTFWPQFIKQHIDPEFEYDWSNLHCEGVELNEDYLLVAYTFPEPEEPPQAKYGAVIINRHTNKTTYYTFEMSFDGLWVLGSKTPEGHYNYGSVEDKSLNDFIIWVFDTMVADNYLEIKNKKLPS